jgi:hypothetical protein
VVDRVNKDWSRVEIVFHNFAVTTIRTDGLAESYNNSFYSWTYTIDEYLIGLHCIFIIFSLLETIYQIRTRFNKLQYVPPLASSFKEMHLE